MAWTKKKGVQYALAGMGVVYILLFAGYLVYAFAGTQAPSGPSELEAHPERQAEILARQRAEEMQGRLGLSEEQTKQIAGIFAGQEGGQPADGDPRERWRAMREEVAKVLTPEQQAQMEQERGRFGGPGGGPGGPRGMMMSPERMEALKAKMTPEQRERFEKKAQQWQQRRGQRGGGRGGQGPQRPGPPQQ